MAQSAYVRLAHHVQWRSRPDGALILDTSRQKVYVTSETGREILSLMNGGHAAPDIVDRLGDAYAAEPEQIEADVEEFFDSLRACGLLA